MRRGVGVDLSEEYLRIAERRVSGQTAGYQGAMLWT